jgi:Uri superfamily endonuclease
VKGIYALTIRLTEDAIVGVGALGEKRIAKGLYVYVGSAQANLRQRVRRHFRKEKRLFWHIDYLLDSPLAKTEKAFWMGGDKATECVIAKEIGERGKPVVGFGCSDCRCVSHLYRVNDTALLTERMHELMF